MLAGVIIRATVQLGFVFKAPKTFRCGPCSDPFNLYCRADRLVKAFDSGR